MLHFGSRIGTSKMSQLNEFYVCLSSDSSLSVYQNTKSYFTNQLLKSFKLNKNWVVGLTEIFLSPIQQEEEKPKTVRQKRSSIYNPKQKELVVYPFGQSENVKIIFSVNNFKTFQYEENHMNFGRFLEVLPLYISPISDAMKRKIKLKMFSIINELNLGSERIIKPRSNHILHIYMGSTKSNNVKLSYETFNSLEDFLWDILQQLPPVNLEKKNRFVRSILPGNESYVPT